MTTSEETAQSLKKPRGYVFAGATVLVLGLVSWLAQVAAASAFGIVEYLKFDGAPTGGLVAVVASIAVWAKCRSWQTWVKWIWLPIAITVVMAFIMMTVNAQTIATEEEAARLVQEQAQVVSDRKAAAEQACMDLQMQIEAKASEIQELQADLNRATRPSWAAEPPSWALPTAVNEHNRLVTEYNASC